MAKLLNDVKQLTKDQKAVNRRIASLNKRLAKADPEKDKATAKKIEAASTELHYLNEQADMFSATASDPWQFVEDTMQQAIDAQTAGDYDRYEELCDAIGMEDDVDSGTLKDWQDLRQLKADGLMGYRGERWAAELQMRFFDVFEKMNIEAPYPDASEHAYW